MAVLPTPLAPGERFAPDDATLMLPLMVPLPPSVVPELFTVTALPEAVEPFTKSDPPFTAVLPVYVLAPESVHELVFCLVTERMLLTPPFAIAPVIVLPLLVPSSTRVWLLVVPLLVAVPIVRLAVVGLTVTFPAGPPDPTTRFPNPRL